MCTKGDQVDLDVVVQQAVIVQQTVVALQVVFQQALASEPLLRIPCLVGVSHCWGVERRLVCFSHGGSPVL